VEADDAALFLLLLGIGTRSTAMPGMLMLSAYSKSSSAGCWTAEVKKGKIVDNCQIFNYYFI